MDARLGRPERPPSSHSWQAVARMAVLAPPDVGPGDAESPVSSAFRRGVLFFTIPRPPRPQPGALPAELPPPRGDAGYRGLGSGRGRRAAHAARVVARGRRARRRG